MKFITFIATCLVVIASVCVLGRKQQTIDNSGSIRVGAVQVFPVTSGQSTPLDIIQATARSAISTMLDANEKSGVHDLFTLPEFLFTGNVGEKVPQDCSGDGTNKTGKLAGFCSPVPPAGTNLGCADGLPLTTPMRIIGCQMLARAPNTTAVSINVCERAENGTLYNTQVVVRAGMVVARYRKAHPFFETCYSKPTLEIVTFNIKQFRFGVFTCFDFFWPEPKQRLIDLGVKYFTYSVSLSMVSDFALELWSAKEKVTIVASNAQADQTSVIVDGKAVQKCGKMGACVASAVLQ